MAAVRSERGSDVTGPPPLSLPDRLAAARLRPRSGSSPALNRLAELAARLLGSPASQVSLLTEDQLVAGGAGLAVPAVGSRSPLGDSLCTVTATGRAPLVVTEARADERVAHLPPVASGSVGSYLGVPLLTDEGVVGALCVFDHVPRQWSESDLVVLQQLAASAVAELELSALSEEFGLTRARWELAIEAAGIGSFDYDLTAEEVVWDERFDTLLGIPAGSARAMELFYSLVHPDDREGVVSAIQRAVECRGAYEAEYRVVRPDGEQRWVQARGRVLSDASGRPERLLGAAYDTTAAREGEAKVLRLLETMSVGFAHLDREWRVAYMNAEAERVLGLRRQDLLGGVLWDLFPALAGTSTEEAYRRAAETREPVTIDAYYPEPLNAWYEIRMWPGPDGLSVYFLDITARRLAQEQTQRAAERSALLARVASELGGTLDAEEAVGRLARLVVPTLADWCIVTLVDDEPADDLRRGVRDIASWHRDPERRPLVEEYAVVRLAALADRSPLAGPLATGQPFVLAEGVVERIGAALGTDEARALLRRLDPGSAAVLPLRAHGRTLGLITLALDAGSPRGLDLDTALDVASRAGLALDNARLYEQQRRLAEGLQRALLTDPPQPDHLQIVVRYEPAAEVAQVGGDWHDAFVEESGDTVVVIGDVVGHDTAAAAAMGQVRGLLRGIAVTTGAGPAEVLRRLDAAMDLLRVETTATAVLARLSPVEGPPGTAVQLTWSSAGHPPPLLLGPDGSVQVLEAADADLLLGIDPTSRRSESTVLLERGTTLFLYTDGLVERRGQALDDGIGGLAAALADLAGLELGALCDALLARLVGGRSEDDVAIAAVRLLGGPDRGSPDEAVRDAPAVGHAVSAGSPAVAGEGSSGTTSRATPRSSSG